MHPVLSELRKDFGIEQIEPVEVEIGTHQWTLRPLDPSDYDWATGIASKITGNVQDANALAQQMMGNALKIERATTSIAVAAIDGVPTYEIFDVSVGKLVIHNPLRPPTRIRQEAAKRVLAFLTEGVEDSGVNMELAGALSRAYTEHIEPKLSLEKMQELAADAKDPLDG